MTLPLPDSVPGPTGAAGSPMRNIGLLATAQAIIGSNQAVLAAIASLTAVTLLDERSLSTLPVTLMIVGTALATGPSAWLIHRLGRRHGFMLGAALAIPGALLAALAAWLGSFWLFCVALALLGTTAAFANQYRFAAADSVPPGLKARAISWVLAGGVVSGFLGPWLGVLTKDLLPGHSFAGTYIAMALLALGAVLVLSQTRLAPGVRSDGVVAQQSPRSFSTLLRSAEILIPMLVGSSSYALMVLVMVAAPLAMVYVCGHTTEEAAFAIQWHVVAMFAPSFVTGSIIGRIGAHLTAALGLLMILCAAIINLNGISVMHFVVSLVLLGVGWNFGFIASTAMLSTAYRPEEAARVQGLNEQVVFGSMAVASIASGVLLEVVGWHMLNVLAIPVATAAILALAFTSSRKAATAG